MPQSQSIYNAFEPADFDAWKKQVVKEVKGEEAFAALYKTTAEGVHVHPYYTLADIEGKDFSAISTAKQDWTIQEHVNINGTDTAEKITQDLLNKGTEQVVFIVNDELVINKLTHLESNTLCAKGFIPSSSKAYVDALMVLAENGDWGSIPSIINKSNTTYLVDAAPYHNAGANTCTEIALTLAHANEYLNLGVQKLTLNLAVGSDYFFEIAKLRAMRKLYALLAQQYSADEAVTIQCETALNNKTIYDYNNNILRTTSEAMSAVVGGCDALYVYPYDVLFKQPHDFSARIARNIQLVLKKESYLDKVTDAAHGSYYIESLSNEIATKSWDLFKEIEAKGGWIAGIQSGFLQETVTKQAQATQQLVDEGKQVILGVNKYPNANEKMKGEIEPVQLADNKLFPLHRFAAKAEQERLGQE